MSFAAAASRFSIGPATLKCWAKRVEPKTYERKKVRKISLEALRRDVKDYPDDYQYERAARFGVCPKAIWQALKKLDVTYKKALKHPQADAGARHILCERIREFSASGRPLIYVDESGFAHDIPRTHGYAPRGKRCLGVQDWGAKGRSNVIGALLAGALLTCWLCDCNVDSNVFYAWITQDLLPKLPQVSVIVMDNATFHKRADIQKAVANGGHSILYLPP